LDEPTSGLDSTSALDLAHVLHSIAALGLTIVSVIHQPRVEIFKAFDDVLLIAPGGRTAYFGPVDKAQAYFESLGFMFEQTANPADILMDILSGKGQGVKMSVDEIVEAWEHRSWVPKGIVTSGGGGLKPGQQGTGSASSSTTDLTSLVGGVHDQQQQQQQQQQGKNKDDEKFASTTTTTLSASNVEAETAPSVSSSSVETMKSLVKTRGAPFLTQTYFATLRATLQQTRFLGALALELFVAGFAGFIMGFAVFGEEGYKGILKAPYTLISSSSNEWFIGLYGMLVGIAIALSGSPSGVKVFGEEKPVYWREAASGHSKFAYYLGKSLSVVPRIALSAAHFTGLYYVLAKPVFGIGTQYALIFLNFFAVYGMSVIVSMLVRRENASLLAVIVGLFSAVFCGYGPSITDAKDGGYFWVCKYIFCFYASYIVMMMMLTTFIFPPKKHKQPPPNHLDNNR
jgi:hypothetical protein